MTVLYICIRNYMNYMMKSCRHRGAESDIDRDRPRLPYACPYAYVHVTAPYVQARSGLYYSLARLSAAGGPRPVSVGARLSLGPVPAQALKVLSGSGQSSSPTLRLSVSDAHIIIIMYTPQYYTPFERPCACCACGFAAAVPVPWVCSATTVCPWAKAGAEGSARWASPVVPASIASTAACGSSPGLH